MDTPLPPDLLSLLGRIEQAWARLDFGLRYLLKRTIRHSQPLQVIPDSENRRIAAVLGHQLVMREILDYLERQPNKSPLRSKIKEIKRTLACIGEERSRGLYGLRNEAIHSIYWCDSGVLWRHRIGLDEVGAVYDEWSAHLEEIEQKIAGVARKLISIAQPEQRPGAPTVAHVTATPVWPKQ